MTEHNRTAEDIKRAWASFRGPHDFHTQPILRLPLRHGSKFDAPVSDYMLPSTTINFCEIRLERGFIDGKRMECLVGSVPKSAIRVILEITELK